MSLVFTVLATWQSVLSIIVGHFSHGFFSLFGIGNMKSDSGRTSQGTDLESDKCASCSSCTTIDHSKRYQNAIINTSSWNGSVRCYIAGIWEWLRFIIVPVSRYKLAEFESLIPGCKLIASYADSLCSQKPQDVCVGGYEAEINSILKCVTLTGEKSVELLLVKHCEILGKTSFPLPLLIYFQFWITVDLFKNFSFTNVRSLQKYFRQKVSNDE